MSAVCEEAVEIIKNMDDDKILNLLEYIKSNSSIRKVENRVSLQKKFIYETVGKINIDENAVTNLREGSII